MMRWDEATDFEVMEECGICLITRGGSAQLRVRQSPRQIVFGKCNQASFDFGLRGAFNLCDFMWKQFEILGKRYEDDFFFKGMITANIPLSVSNKSAASTRSSKGTDYS